MPPAPAPKTDFPPVPGNRFPKRLRLQANRDIRQAYEQNHSVHGRYMVIFRRNAPDAHFRLGVVASRRVGGSPERALAKRRLRELYRLNRHAFAPDQADLVIVARRPILTAPWPRLLAEYLRLLPQLGFQPPPPS